VADDPVKAQLRVGLVPLWRMSFCRRSLPSITFNEPVSLTSFALAASARLASRSAFSCEADQVTPFFAYPAEIRKVIYTTNAVESLNMSLRKVIKTRGSFPNEEAALKLLYLGLERVAKKWTRPVQDWKAALNRFAIVY
jgi:transposase-like protein